MIPETQHYHNTEYTLLQPLQTPNPLNQKIKGLILEMIMQQILFKRTNILEKIQSNFQNTNNTNNNNNNNNDINKNINSPLI